MSTTSLRAKIVERIALQERFEKDITTPCMDAKGELEQVLAELDKVIADIEDSKRLCGCVEYRQQEATYGEVLDILRGKSTGECK